MKSILRQLFGMLFTLTASAETLTIAGSGTVATAITPAIEEFKKTTGIEVALKVQPSARGIFALAEGQAQIGLTVESVNDAQRQLYPAVTFHSTPVGRGAIFLLVSPDIWRAGVHALSSDQVRSIIEKKTGNWSALRGPNVEIQFISPRGGSLSNFSMWVYGKSTPEREAAIRSHSIAKRVIGSGYQVSGSGYKLPKVIGDSHGMLGALSECFRPGASAAHKLAILAPDGTIEPTAENISNGRYPMSFDLQLVTNGAPNGIVKQFITFLLSAKGQAMIEAEGYAPLPPTGTTGVNQSSK